MKYLTAFISPLITVPCPIVICRPIVTSPIIVALGAMNTYPVYAGFILYKGITGLALLIVSENLLGA